MRIWYDLFLHYSQRDRSILWSTYIQRTKHKTPQRHTYIICSENKSYLSDKFEFKIIINKFSSICCYRLLMGSKLLARIGGWLVDLRFMFVFPFTLKEWIWKQPSVLCPLLWRCPCKTAPRQKEALRIAGRTEDEWQSSRSSSALRPRNLSRERQREIMNDWNGAEPETEIATIINNTRTVPILAIFSSIS